MVIPREVVIDPVETTRQPLTKAYLLGALHDATVRRITYRIGAKDLSYAKFLKEGIVKLGFTKKVRTEITSSLSLLSLFFLMLRFDLLVTKLIIFEVILIRMEQ